MRFFVCCARYALLIITPAHVLFSTPAAAQEAVTKLHAHVFKGSLLSVTLKKRLDGLAKAPKKVVVSDPSSSKSVDSAARKGPAPSRASRLIVRNLPWDITEQDLRAVFLPYGPIYSIHIPAAEVQPKDEETGEQPRARAKGYAFVWMLSKKDAEKALEGANGTKMRAGMADGMVRDKQKKKKLRREEAKIKQKEAERRAKRKQRDEDGEDEEDDDESAEESEAEEEAPERPIAVDWALSKDKWAEAKAKLQEEASEEEANASEAEDSEDSDSEDDSHIGLHDDSEGDDSDATSHDGDSDESMSDGEDSKPGKPHLPDTDVGTTLFVRNIPFEATEDELRTVYVPWQPQNILANRFFTVSEHLGLCAMRVSLWTTSLDARGELASFASGIKKTQTRLSSKAIFSAKRLEGTRQQLVSRVFRQHGN